MRIVLNFLVYTLHNRIIGGITNSMNIIGSDIRLRREEIGLSLRKFAGEVGISPTYLSQVETGAQYPSIDILKSIYSLFPDDQEEIKINNIIKNHPELLLVLQLFSDVNRVKNLQYARYVAITYITSLYIASLLSINTKLKSGLKFEIDNTMIQEKDLETELGRIIVLENIFCQYRFEVKVTNGLRQLDIYHFKNKNNYKNEILDLVNSGQLDLAQIAKKSQLTENYIKQILDGNRNPTVKIKQRLIESLGLQVTTPVTYGIPKEYTDSLIIQRIFGRTNDIRQLPDIPFNKVIEFAVEFTTRNITIDTVKKWSNLPDLECAELVIKCFTEILQVMDSPVK